jgi:signal transduction histidine kinase
MLWPVYIRLISLTAGTLLPFFCMVVILGHRRQRNFERIFFFLCLAMTCFFGCSLLALNAQLFYGMPPESLSHFAWTFLCLGLFFIAPLVTQLHAEYAWLRELIKTPQKHFWLAAAWLPALALFPRLWGALEQAGNPDFEQPTRSIGITFQCWLVLTMVVAAVWQYRFQKRAPDEEQKSFHGRLVKVLAVLSVLLFLVFGVHGRYGSTAAAVLDASIQLLALVPFAMLIADVKRFDFLQIGRQRNLIYAVFAVFLALLYLSLVRRAGQWLEPYLPPEATAALLLFLPVIFFEPLQRLIRKLLRQTAQGEVDRAQKLMGRINEMARLGDLEKLRQFAESWIAEQLQLGEVRLSFGTGGVAQGAVTAGRSGSEESFEIHRGSQPIGTLTVRAHGAMVSGETFAALEFVAEQLPAAFELCLLIEEKLQLERELAERERLALVGQMAASISHNLKNPLGSIKTILQVQMENPDLPASFRTEMQMVLDEINRLSVKLSQLLQFSRPGLCRSGAQDRCDVTRVAEDVTGVLRHEAEQRGVELRLQVAPLPLEVATTAEAVNDILSNLLLNAMEATPIGGNVCLSIALVNRHCRIAVEDDGGGIPSALREKILQPFFTTKARGTGLGLAIVARRVEELGGRLELESPIRNERGSRFNVTLPLVTKES